MFAEYGERFTPSTNEDASTITSESLAEASQEEDASTITLESLAEAKRGVKTQTNSTKRTAIVKAIDALASLGADTVTTGSSLSATWRLLWTTEKEQLFIIEKAYLFGTQAGDVLQLLMGWSNKVVLCSESLYVCLQACGNGVR
ncbi:hypothetical protein F8388_002218 [Cannabis sativa]|uniref:Plastid lipid-associated protein/fibrillin conserved domain-containing protein n=1 Tax=Cannabis sativa TaxID=3483 RepID=A0A7J6FX31_CANSA|nr:hypothetical protein F8388_002218 [Cannabis sativa]